MYIFFNLIEENYELETADKAQNSKWWNIMININSAFRFYPLFSILYFYLFRKYYRKKIRCFNLLQHKIWWSERVENLQWKMFNYGHSVKIRQVILLIKRVLVLIVIILSMKLCIFFHFLMPFILHLQLFLINYNLVGLSFGNHSFQFVKFFWIVLR